MEKDSSTFLLDSLVLNKNGLVMKRIFLVLLLFAGVASLSFGRVIAKGDSNTPFGKYTIEVCDQPLMLAGEELKCYLITYENFPETVKVYIDKEKKCKNYVVVTEGLSVTYTCDGEFFGVNKVDPKFKSAGITTNDDLLDRSNYFHQKVIARGVTEEFDATRLIASYYPVLIK
jgi:hypothetical protein